MTTLLKRLAATASIAVLTAIAAPSAAAQSRTYEFDIPAQLLANALRAYAQQTGQEIIFTSTDTSARTDVSLHGSYAPDDALRVLLRDSGLEYTRTQEGVLVIQDPASPTELGAAGSETPSEDSQSGEIVVTAQKRSQSANDVPITLSVGGAEQLASLGITDTRDLGKLSPGFTYAETRTGVPVYTLRGIGFYDSSLASTPAVSTYNDEVPLTYPAMTRGAILDLERVEILKGPQGTLFGANSTGGAINYVAAAPTQTPSFGFNLAAARFNQIDAGGYANIPLTSNAAARLSLQTTQRSDGWQESSTREDTLGEADKTLWRILVDVEATPDLDLRFNLNGWIDRSDTQAAQYIALRPQDPANTPPEYLAQPFADADNQSADWTNSPRRPQLDQQFIQASLRGDYDINGVTLTWLTAVSQLNGDDAYDSDGLPNNAFDFQSFIDIESVFQELRLSGEVDSLLWIVGANYQHDTTHQDQPFLVSTASTNVQLGIFFDGAGIIADTESDTYAIFGHTEWQVSDALTLQAGLRYTHDQRVGSACGYSSGNGAVGDLFETLSSAFRGGAPTPNIGLGDCYTLGDDFLPTLFRAELEEDNISWRAGVSWRANPDNLFYANVSRGYKSGGFPAIPATITTSLEPYTQESVLAYEAGLKSSFLQGRIQTNGAVFYYDYTDKQILGNYLDPIFQILPQLVNIPESRVVGAELQIDAQPTDNLHVTIAATYLDAQIEQFTGYDTLAQFRDLADTRIPFTPEFSMMADAEYEFPIGGNFNGFVGGTVTYTSRSNSGIGELEQLTIDPHTLVDVRLGVRSQDERWSLMAFGRNITDEYYWTTVAHIQDGVVRYAGMPLTYGVQLRVQY